MRVETIKLLGLLQRQAIRMKPHELFTTIEGVQIYSQDILEMVKDIDTNEKKKNEQRTV